MLTQAAPQVKKIGVLWSPTAPHSPILQAIETAGVTLGVPLQLTPVRTVKEFEGAFETMTKERVDAILSWSSPDLVAPPKAPWRSRYQPSRMKGFALQSPWPLQDRPFRLG